MTNHKVIPYIKHIRDAIKDIESFTKGLSEESFLKSKLRQNAVIRELEIVGEASKNIPNSFRVKYAKVEWKAMAGTRDRIVHAYFEVDLNVVWKIIKEDLPKLKKQIEEILEKET